MSSEEVEQSPLSDTPITISELLFAGLKKHNVKATAQVELETGRELTFGHLCRQSLSVVQGLKKEGINEGDIVAIVSYNSQEAHVTILACILLGVTPAPLDPSLNSEEMAALMESVQPKVVYTEGGKTLRKVEAAIALLEQEPILVVSGRNKHPYVTFQSLLQPTDPEFRPSVTNPEEHVALILFTSGTSGLPKAVMIPDTYLVDATALLPKKEFTILLTSPLFWLSGVNVLLASIILGLKIVLLRGPAKEAVVLSTIQNYKINAWITAPTALQSLLVFSKRTAYDMSSMMWVLSVGCGMSADTQLRIQRELFRNRTMVTQGYGLTETGLVAICLPLPNLTKPGSVGIIKPGTELKIEDLETGESLGSGVEGEICLKSSHFMLGYMNNPEATKAVYDEDGWLHTGDIGYCDDDGFVYIVDRIKDLIKYKSYQIAPAELEAILLSHPAVKDVAVFGIPHPTDGDHATAYVVAQKNISENQLLEYVAERVSENKQIRGGIRFVEFIPKTSTGKPKRRALRSQLLAELQGINFMKRWKTAPTAPSKKGQKRTNPSKSKLLLFKGFIKRPPPPP